MNRRTRGVLIGFINLTAEERNELIDELNEYINAEAGKKTTLRNKALQDQRDAIKMHVGPVNEVCACCGR